MYSQKKNETLQSKAEKEQRNKKAKIFQRHQTKRSSQSLEKSEENKGFFSSLKKRTSLA